MGKGRKSLPTSVNDLSHLQLKRFADSDPTLPPGARRDRANRPGDVVAELDPSGRATCRHCGTRLEKGEVRLVLNLQCHKGYKVGCPLHVDGCFPAYNDGEAGKLESLNEARCPTPFASLNPCSISTLP
ncbi:hypothetical protein T484DRAFT_1740406 [Baffinella frigidus]|nr:hypothetical protein T484DRAFT_1740406 [Cryptophyta sp. CCMP2293]